MTSASSVARARRSSGPRTALAAALVIGSGLVLGSGCRDPNDPSNLQGQPGQQGQYGAPGQQGQYGAPGQQGQYGAPQGQYPQQPGQYGTPQGQYPQQQGQYPQPQGQYPQQPGQYPQQQPAAPAAPASPLALPCQSDMICGTHKCNMTTAHCAFPCAANTDCIGGFSCMGAGGPTAICVPGGGGQ